MYIATNDTWMMIYRGNTLFDGPFGVEHHKHINLGNLKGILLPK